MTIIKCVCISREFEDLAAKHHLSWTEAARVGMSIMLAEEGVIEYSNSLNLVRKMQVFQRTAEKAMQDLADFKEKHGIIEEVLNASNGKCE